MIFSSSSSWERLVEASKIAPHSFSLLAEHSVFAFDFFERHTNTQNTKAG